MQQRVSVSTLGMTRRLAIAAVAIGLPLLSADAAMACSCVQLNLREQLKESDGAFIGRLVAVRDVDGDPPVSTADPVDFIYRVRRVYNGGPGLHRGRRVRVRSARYGASCGLPDRVGQLIGLFVQRRNRRWHGNVCLTTTPRKMRSAAEANSSAATATAGNGCG